MSKRNEIIGFLAEVTSFIIAGFFLGIKHYFKSGLFLGLAFCLAIITGKIIYNRGFTDGHS